MLHTHTILDSSARTFYAKALPRGRDFMQKVVLSTTSLQEKERARLKSRTPPRPRTLI